MVKKTVVLLEDDIDGSEASETVLFGLDGSDYEIDLTAGHANELREALQRYTAVARKTSGGRGRPDGRKSSQEGPNPKTVRQWAAENGLNVNARGRIQADIVRQYEAAH
jgi:hypothetical protein